LIKISKSDTDFKKRYPKKISIPETTKSTPKIKIKKRRRNKNTRNQNKGRGMRVRSMNRPQVQVWKNYPEKDKKCLQKCIHRANPRETQKI